MDAKKPPLLTRLVAKGALGALAVAMLVWPASLLLAAQAQRLQLIAPFDDATVQVNKFTYAEDPTGKTEDVVAIYGSAFGEPEDVLFADADAIVRPSENEDLALLKKGADQNPLQVQTVRYLTRLTSLGAALAALGLGVLLVLLRRRGAGARPSEA